jgi:3-hydroxyisobutyrate dehydrogenase
VVDCSTVSSEVSALVRLTCAQRGASFLAAPVSGNPKVVAAGQLTLAVSGTREAFDVVRPYFDQLGHGVTYVGDDEVARLVKICHNMFLGVVTQALAEITCSPNVAASSAATSWRFLTTRSWGPPSRVTRRRRS